MIANRNAALLPAMLAGGTAHAAGRMVTLTRPLPLAQSMAAEPRIADPRDAAERRINAALGRLDGTVRKAASPRVISPGCGYRDVVRRGPSPVIAWMVSLTRRRPNNRTGDASAFPRWSDQ